jgi:hypothetical protein
MGKGLGSTQQAILDALPTQAGKGATTSGLAAKLGRSPRQIRAAVTALADRGLIAVHKQVIDWKPRADGEHMPVYGALVMSLQSWADWLEYQQQIRDREVRRADELAAFSARLKQYGLGGSPQEAADYHRAREDRINALIDEALT